MLGTLRRTWLQSGQQTTQKPGGNWSWDRGGAERARAWLRRQHPAPWETSAPLSLEWEGGSVRSEGQNEPYGANKDCVFVCLP